MNLAGNTVLITGGATGIGFALAERFLQAGSEVIICGRRADALAEAKRKHLQLHTRVCDLAEEAQRRALHEWVVTEFPALNVLVNNAGIQRRVKFSEDQAPWPQRQQELAINIEAPTQLSALFLPHLLKQAGAAIVNVSSGLAFTPASFATVYSATKAYLHALCLSLRYELANTAVAVVEIVPPAVQTDLGGVGVHAFGVPLDAFADSVMERLGQGELEIGYGRSEAARKASRAELEEMLRQINQL